MHSRRKLWQCGRDAATRVLYSNASFRHLEDLGSWEWLNDTVKKAETQYEQENHGLPTDLAYVMVYECNKRQDLKLLRRVQSLIIQNGLDSLAFLVDHVIRLFATCGSLIEANQAFNKVSEPSLYTWNAVIEGCAKFFQGDMAISLYHNLQQKGSNPDKFTFLSMLKVCSSTNASELGRMINGQVIESTSQDDISVGNALIHMYARNNMLEEAQHILDQLPVQDVISWTGMITGYAQNGMGHLAIDCFEEMQNNCIKPNKVTFLGLLKACSNLSAIEHARCFHEQILDNGIASEHVVANSLIDMYVKCGTFDEALALFNNLHNQDVVSWSEMIAGYANYGKGDSALKCFDNMQQRGIKPTKVTFLNVLKACSNGGTLEHVRYIHDQIFERGFHSDNFVGNTLIDAYAKCGSLKDAYRVFSRLLNQDVVSCNLILITYSQHDLGYLALQFFNDMQQNGTKMNKFTFPSILKACGSINAIEQGRHIHEQIVEHGLKPDVVVGSSLIDMYAKCGSLEEAELVFNTLPSRNTVTWNAMIGSFVQLGENRLAIRCFSNMQHGLMKPDKFTYSSILVACGAVGAMLQGRHIHEQIIKDALGSDLVVGSSLVEMYSQCGCLVEARRVFDSLLNHDSLVWGGIITGYAQFGEAEVAVDRFENMQKHGIQPNNKAVTSVLCAFNHSGLVDEAICYFETMSKHQGIQADTYHISCMVDLLARSGHFHKAKNMLTDAFHDHIYPWMILLSACERHCNLDLGKQCFDVIITLDPVYAPAHVMMSNIYGNGNQKHFEIERHSATLINSAR